MYVLTLIWHIKVNGSLYQNAHCNNSFSCFQFVCRYCGTAFGEKATYTEIAERVGRPRANRAVGAANSVNPLPLVVPCHRVVAASGKLQGYAGGLAMKARLLALETAAPREGWLL